MKLNNGSKRIRKYVVISRDVHSSIIGTYLAHIGNKPLHCDGSRINI